MDLAPLERCLAPIVTVSTEDKDSLHPVKEGDERPDHAPSIFDPPGNLWEKEYQYPQSTMEVMIARLFQQVWDLLKCLEDCNRKPIPWNDEANVKVKGLNNILLETARRATIFGCRTQTFVEITFRF